MLDALADSLEFTACEGDAVGKLLRINHQIYVMSGDTDRLTDAYRDVVEREAYQTAELVDTCDFL